MRQLDAEARRWLEAHAHELEPETILFEEEKAAIAAAHMAGRWPVPVSVRAMSPFDQIEDEASFNRVVGDPGLWNRVLQRSDLYEFWVRPQAVLLFGKKWFDCVKWKPTIQRHAPFPLFTDIEKSAAQKAGVRLEDTEAGRSKIAQITSKVEHALEMYLRGGGRAANGGIKRPGGYIVDSIRNEFVQEIGRDLGYRTVREPVCPHCLVRKKGKGKVRQPSLLEVRGRRYSCPECSERVRNLRLNSDEDGQVEDLARTLLFSDMPGAFCVCPTPRCPGKFVPLHSLSNQISKGETQALEKIRPMKGTGHGRKPPSAVLDLQLCCPFCTEKFTPRQAMDRKSGFKRLSGMLVGPPTIHVWRKVEEQILDRGVTADGVQHFSAKEDLAAVIPHPSDRIAHQQRANIAAGEMLIKIASCRSDTVSSLLSRCFYAAVMEWTSFCPADASRYLFSESGGARGRDGAVHQSIVRLWLAEIRKRLPEFKKVKGIPQIRSLKDVPWLCHPPRHSSGPTLSFAARLGADLSVAHDAEPVGGHRPRMATVLSVKDSSGREILKHMSSCEWHAIRISSGSGLSEGDLVKVKALMMPGHHSHAPIKRIMRLRADVMEPISQRVRKEEAGGVRDMGFWRAWSERVERARKKMETE